MCSTISSRRRIVGRRLFAFVVLIGSVSPLFGTTYTITDTRDVVADDLLCTLREALTAAVDRVAVDVCPAGTASNTIHLGFGTYAFDRGTFQVPNSIDPIDLEIVGINGDLVGTRIDLGNSNGFVNVFGVSFGTEIAHRLRLAGVQIQNAAVTGTSTVGLSGSGALIVENVNFVDGRCVADCGLAATAIGFSGSADLTIRDSLFARNGAPTSLFLRPDGATVRIERSLMSENVGGLHVRADGDTSTIVEDLAIERAGVDEDAVLIAFLELNDQSTTTASRVTVRDNIHLVSAPIAVDTSESATLAMSDWDLARNQGPDAGALSVRSSDSSAISIDQLVASNNTSASGSNALVGAVSLLATESARITWTRGKLRANVTASSGFEPAAGLHAVGRAGGDIVLDRLELLDNRHVGPSSADLMSTRQLTAIADDPGSTLTLRNSLIASSPGLGLRLSSIDGASVDLLGSTIAANRDSLTFVTEDDRLGAPSQFNNNLLFGNDNDTPTLLGDEVLFNAFANLIGVDPLWLSPLADDYRLQAGSPAIDGGQFIPSTALGALDLAGRPRLIAGQIGGFVHPDVGAFEFEPGELFANGFDSGTTSRWTSTVGSTD